MSTEETYDSPELLEEEMDFSDDSDLSDMPLHTPIDPNKDPSFSKMSLVKRRNIGKIAEYLMENPQATIPEISRATDLSV